jgi:arylsulfatase A-like enzyme
MNAREVTRACGLAAALALLPVVAPGACGRSGGPSDPPGAAEKQGQTQAAPPARTSPGSPGATTSVDTKHLPAPAASFGGIVAPNADQSKPWWPPQVRPREGAPNVLLIITDDVGFGAPSTFGGTIPTPTLDRIAKTGLRYTAFHSTALCSPTRAALITGRNHHSVHTGAVVEQATGYPGYNTLVGKDTATIGEILKQNGYATSWFGKEHNTPIWEATQLGPFDRWPVGYGFQYFYGFVGGDTSQWQPNLFRNQTAIEPYVGHPGWNLITAMADDAISYVKQLNELSPGQPFLVYYAPGGTHAPHHPMPEWAAKFRGKFDAGWNALRDEIFADQKKLGVIPQNARLTEWPKDLPLWDSLSPDEKKLYARQAEVYAGYLAYTDNEIGRVVQAVEDIGKLNDTLVIYISGDNGASPEGTLTGTFNEIAPFNGVNLSAAEQMRFYDAWGSDKTYPHMAVGWSWAFDTPFKWTKEVASHFGGTRQGMAMAWPNRIKDKGGIRWQFHHVIDIAPTILEACGIEQPIEVNGAPQKPIEGVSMVYSWDKANANAPTRHTTQYFEMFATRAIYRDGWVAAAPSPVPPWQFGTVKAPPDPMNSYKWELYNVNEDFTESDDLASKMPDKLRELKEVFTQEATKYDVFPLDNAVATRLYAPRPDLTAGRTVFTYSGELTNVAWGGAPSLLDKSYTITAEIDVPPGGAEGVLVTQGGRFGGYGFYLLRGRPVFTWNLLALAKVRWEGGDALAQGKHTLAFDFKYDGGGMGKGGQGVLTVDGKQIAAKRMDKTIPVILAWDEAFNVGVDTGTSVDSEDYEVPFRFTGTLRKLTIKLTPMPMRAEEKTMQEKGQRDNKASE